MQHRPLVTTHTFLGVLRVMLTLNKKHKYTKVVVKKKKGQTFNN